MNSGRVAMRYISTQYGPYWWPRRKIDGKTQQRGLFGANRFTKRNYHVQTSSTLPYDPSRDIDFVVPKRLQEADILDIIGTTIAEELLARRKAEEMSGRIDLRPYEWYSVQHRNPGMLARLPFNLDPRSNLPVAALPQGEGRHPHLQCEIKMAVPDSGSKTDLYTGQIEDTGNPGSLGTQSTDNNLIVTKGPRNGPLEVKEMELALHESVSFSAFDREPLEVSEYAPNHETAKHPEHELQEQKPLEVEGIKYKTGIDAHMDSTSDPISVGTQYQLSPYAESANLPNYIDDERPYCREASDEDEEQYQALKIVRGTRLNRRAEVEGELEKNAVSKNIHILGMGSVGKFVAHTLAGLTNPPPVTLLMHRPLLMQQWHEEGGAITLLKNGQLHTRSGFSIESSADFRRESPYQRFAGFGKNLEHTSEPPNTVIDTLIVTTDANTTISALLAVKSRLRQSSTICFVQDGMGIVEKVNAMVFSDPYRRPTYILSSISHKLAPSGKTFTIIEQRSGTITCSKLPQRHTSQSERNPPLIKRSDFSWTPQASNLVGTIARIPEFNTETLGHKSFYRHQLETVAVNAVIGPLSVMFDCSNDQLLFNYSATQIMRSILNEVSLVLRSLPELRSFRHMNKQFSADKLEAIVVSTIRRSGKNLTSMLQHVRAGKRTDIEFYNGYLVNRGVELGIHCPVNEMLINTVKAKQMMKKRELDSYIPFKDKY